MKPLLSLLQGPVSKGSGTRDSEIPLLGQLFFIPVGMKGNKLSRVCLAALVVRMPLILFRNALLFTVLAIM